MDKLTPDQIRAKRSEAQALAVTLHIGKGGVNDKVVAELDAQLKTRKLVKARLLPSSAETGAGDEDPAEALAAATHATLIERRGHTAVFFRP